MGIEINSYRARIGRFVLGLRPRIHKVKYRPYTGHYKGTDIHLRTFVCGVFALLVFGMFYGVTFCRVYVESHWSITHYIGDTSCTYRADSVLITSSCSNLYTAVVYGSYYNRLLMLSSDVEQNPGPTKDTEMIMDALRDIRSDVGAIKHEMSGVKGCIAELKIELRSIKTDIESLSNKIESVEKAQKATKTSLTKLEAKVGELEYNCELMNNDMACLSYHDEARISKMTAFESQLSIIENERLKASLRIFGVEEIEDETRSLKALINDKVFSKTNPEEGLGEDSIKSAKRVGSKHEGDSRMIVVKFKNEDDKFRLFKYREILRGNKIRISNDLSFMQRQKLKEVKESGLKGYFKGGKLITLPAKANQTQRVFKRANRQNSNQNDLAVQEPHDMDTTQSNTWNSATEVWQ